MARGLDRRSDRPAYHQIADRLREAILSDELAAGSRLPSERALIEEYDAARGTVRQALAVLRAEGLIQVEHGRGAFVRSRPPIRRLSHDRFARRHREEGKAAFLAEMDSQQRRPTVEILELGAAPASPEVARALWMCEGDEVFVRRRLYLADDQPVETATSYLPLELVKGTPICEKETGPGGIYARLEDLGHGLARFTEEVSARMPHPEEAKLLDLPAGVPVLRVLRRAIDTDDRVVEVCDTVMAADRYVLDYQLPAD